MPSFGFPNSYDNDLANKGFFARMGLIGIASLAFIGPLVAIVNGPPKLDWNDYSEWYDVKVDFFESSAVCQKMRSTTSEECPQNWVPSQVGLRCYQRLPIQKFRSGELEKSCAFFGGELVTIPDSGVNKEVFEVCAENQPCFIGLELNMITQEWEWMSKVPGEQKVAQYLNWAKEEPNNLGVAETYAVIGISRAAQALADMIHNIILSAILSAAVGGCVCTLVCFGIWYQGINTRDKCCLQTSLCCDGCGSCCECLSVIGGVGALVGGFSFLTLWSTLVSAFSATFFVVSLWVTYTLYSNISRRQADGVPTVVGQPVVGNVVGQGGSYH